MPDRWFRVPDETIDGQHGPKYRTRAGVTGVAGNRVGNGNAPHWVARFYADDASTLDAIAAESDAHELTADQAAQRFGNADVPWLADVPWDAARVDRSFAVGAAATDR